MKPLDLAWSGLALCASLAAFAAPVSVPSESTRMHAKGTFDVKVTPQQADNPDARAAGVDRLSLNKTFHGPLDAISQGEMLAIGDGTQSGGYVAIEKITGTLDGREGSFALLHSAMMRNSTPERWSVAVVPDSGTGALKGIDGAMTIAITDGKHYYDLTYTLPAAE